MFGQTCSGEGWPWAQRVIIGSMCADQQAPSKSGLINLLWGLWTPFGGLIKAHLFHTVVYGSQQTLSLPACHGPGIKAPSPTEGSVHCLGVSCPHHSTDWSGTQFLRPLSTVGTKQDFGSEERDGQGQAHICAKTWELWTFQTNIKHSPSYEEELAILSLPCKSPELVWWAYLASHGPFLPHFFMSLPAEITC